jgi:hypothetical protein
VVELEEQDALRMMKSRSRWEPKLHPEQEAKLVPDHRGRMLVPTPMLVAEELRRVRIRVSEDLERRRLPVVVAMK